MSRRTRVLWLECKLGFCIFESDPSFAGSVMLYTEPIGYMMFWKSLVYESVSSVCSATVSAERVRGAVSHTGVLQITQIYPPLSLSSSSSLPPCLSLLPQPFIYYTYKISSCHLRSYIVPLSHALPDPKSPPMPSRSAATGSVFLRPPLDLWLASSSDAAIVSPLSPSQFAISWI
ncbi:hypothetical protein PIB30_066487 [Stylosanthes scabra]|uniref:Uncharacterized protein n=1 Tax=Stylosanthes scabra TaxID=79078 RepID=A0ABU6QLT1_9FABA|nr:hypothetical protein [Stylosanthes scabra]